MEETDLKVGTFVFATYPGIIMGRDASDGMYAILTLRNNGERGNYYRNVCESSSSTPQEDIVVPGYGVDLSEGFGFWVSGSNCRPLTQDEKDELIKGLVKRGALLPMTATTTSVDSVRPWVTSASELVPGDIIIYKDDSKCRMVVGVHGSIVCYVKPNGGDGHIRREKSKDTRPIRTPSGESFVLGKTDGYSTELSDFSRFATDSEIAEFYSRLRACGALVPATKTSSPTDAEPASRLWPSSRDGLAPGDIVVNSRGVRMILGVNPDGGNIHVLRDYAGNDGKQFRDNSKDTRPIKLPAGYSIHLEKGNAAYSSFEDMKRFATPSEVNRFYDKLKSIGVLVPTSVTAPPPSQPSVTYRFKVGDKVKRDPQNWSWGDQDGGEGNEGIVKDLMPVNDPSVKNPFMYRVHWPKGRRTYAYRDMDLQPYSSDAVNPVDDGNHVGKFHLYGGKAYLVIWYDPSDKTMACVKDSGTLTTFHWLGVSTRPVITDSYISSILRDCHHPKKRALKLDEYGWKWFGKSEFTPAPDSAIGQFFDEYGVDIDEPVVKSSAVSDPPKLLITDIKVGDFLQKGADGPRLITGIDRETSRVSYVINENGYDALDYKLGSESIPIPGYHSLNLRQLNGFRDSINSFTRRSTPAEAQELIDKMVAKGALIPDQELGLANSELSEPEPDFFEEPYDPSGESSPASAKVDTGHRSIHDVEVSFVSV